LKLLPLLVIVAASLAVGQSTTRSISVRDYGAKGDGNTDDLRAIQRAILASQQLGRRILFPAGTYGVSKTLTIPNKTQLVGVGRGDPGINTVIKALPGFSKNDPVVRMGDAEPSFGVRIENLTIDGSGVAPVCLENRTSEEQSAGRDLLLLHCTSAPLYIAGSGAQNSGPFEDLEIYPAPASAKGVCVRVENVISFRGMRGLTCNAGTGGLRPDVALALDGGGLYEDIHVEHFATGISLGSKANSADALTIINGQFGPAVDTAISIQPRAGNQNITVIGISCVGCRALLADGIMGVTNTHTSLGFYSLGDGPEHSKPVLSTMHK
jgi:Pectate lyase superfamily protein